MLLVGGIQSVIFLIVAEAIYPGYNVSLNYISDLGVWGKPSAPLFNTSIVVFGLMVLAAALLIRRQSKNRLAAVFLALTGLGSAAVGFFPENTFYIGGVPLFHTIAALVVFVSGGIAAISTSRITESPFNYVSAALGVASLAAFALFASTAQWNFLGLGPGGMERMITYPMTAWIIAFGGYLAATGK